MIDKDLVPNILIMNLNIISVYKIRKDKKIMNKNIIRLIAIILLVIISTLVIYFRGPVDSVGYEFDRVSPQVIKQQLNTIHSEQL